MSTINIVIPLTDRNDGVYNEYADFTFDVDVMDITGIDHFRISIPSARLWSINKSIDVTKFKGILRQYTATGQTVRTDEFEVTPTTNVTIPIGENVAYITVAITSWQYTVTNSTGIYYHNQAYDSDVNVFRIRVENAENNALATINVVCTKIIWSYHNPTTYKIQAPNTEVAFTPEISNITDFIDSWYIWFTGCVGTPNPMDSITIQLLDEANNVLSEMSGGISGEGNVSTSHDVTTYKVRIAFNVSTKIVFNGKIAIMGKSEIAM